jgi:hypothetical protein
MAKRIWGLVFALFLISVVVLPILSCGPKTPLTITISQPTEGASIPTNSFQVRGTVSDAKATVMVNDVKASITPKGYFGANLTLVKGENTINVVATRGEETMTMTLKVTCTATK